jgi:hypothetical protein
MRAFAIARFLLVGLLAAGIGSSVRADGGPGGGDHAPDGSGRRGRPEIVIDPSAFIAPRQPQPNVDNPRFIMAEIRRCSAAGTLLFVDCLRDNHGSIMIRKLEACVGSEVIPPDVAGVEPCIPLSARP